MNSPNGDRLDDEQRLAGVLRELPPRRAPRSLETRVLEEIERRAIRPWWLRTFAQWPAGARAAFMVVCVVLVALGVLVAGWFDVFGTLHGAGTLGAPAAQLIGDNLTTAQQLGSALFGWIPSSWIRAALTAGALLYVTLFALGAVAYRWLYLGSYLTSNGRYS